jgi:hypothetical protein
LISVRVSRVKSGVYWMLVMTKKYRVAVMTARSAEGLYVGPAAIDYPA